MVKVVETRPSVLCTGRDLIFQCLRLFEKRWCPSQNDFITAFVSYCYSDIASVSQTIQDFNQFFVLKSFILVPVEGLEPPTPSLRSWRARSR